MEDEVQLDSENDLFSDTSDDAAHCQERCRCFEANRYGRSHRDLAEVAAYGVFGRAAGPDFILFGEGQGGYIGKPAGVCKALQLVTVESGALQQVFDLAAVMGVVLGKLLRSRTSFHFRRKHHSGELPR